MLSNSGKQSVHVQVGYVAENGLVKVPPRSSGASADSSKSTWRGSGIAHHMTNHGRRSLSMINNAQPAEDGAGRGRSGPEFRVINHPYSVSPPTSGTLHGSMRARVPDRRCWLSLRCRRRRLMTAIPGDSTSKPAVETDAWVLPLSCPEQSAWSGFDLSFIAPGLS